MDTPGAARRGAGVRCGRVATHVLKSAYYTGRYCAAACDECATKLNTDQLEFFDEKKHNLGNVFGAEIAEDP